MSIHGSARNAPVPAGVLDDDAIHALTVVINLLTARADRASVEARKAPRAVRRELLRHAGRLEEARNVLVRESSPEIEPVRCDKGADCDDLPADADHTDCRILY